MIAINETAQKTTTTFLLPYLLTLIDFVYPDFNETTGIVFNGDSGTTVCWDDPSVSSSDLINTATTTLAHEHFFLSFLH